MLINNNYEVVITTLGENIEGCLAGLIFHAPINIRIVTVKLPTNVHTNYLIEILKQLGCTIRIDVVKSGLGLGRSVALNTDFNSVICLDDDAVILPVGGLNELFENSLEYNWCSPIIRYSQNFVDTKSLPNHTEIWHRVNKDDKKVQRAVQSYGEGWLRVFDTGENITSDLLGGTCFAVRKQLAQTIAHDQTLINWRNMGNEDTYIGKVLGKGIILHNVFAYHYGHYSNEEWNKSSVIDKLVEKDLETYIKYAKMIHENT